MKKLMILLATVAFAIVSHAATMKWQVDYSYQPGADTDNGPFADGWAMAVFDAGNSATASEAMIKALLAADVDSAISTYAVDGKTYAANSVGGTVVVSSGFAGEAGDAISAYLVLFNNADESKATMFYLSDIASGEALAFGMEGKIIFGEDGDLLKSAVADNWTAVAPEPTSGLLLLLGMAGLALRRKQK